jgi:SAM-dependent methyltransferase
MIEIRHPVSPRKGYDQFYSEKGLRQPTSYFLWILDLIQFQAGRRLLDMSCGEGQLLGLATRAGIKGFGLDISREAIRLASLEAPRAFNTVGNGELLPYRDGTFDYIVNLGSLEHYEDPAAGVRQLARVLKKEGRVCVLLPNSFGLLWTVSHAWRTGEIFDDGQPIQRYGTLKEWRNLLEENGLIINRVLKYNGRNRPRTWTDFLWNLRRPRKIVTSLLLLPFIPLRAATMFVFLCSKGKGDT